MRSAVLQHAYLPGGYVDASCKSYQVHTSQCKFVSAPIAGSPRGEEGQMGSPVAAAPRAGMHAAGNHTIPFVFHLFSLTDVK